MSSKIKIKGDYFDEDVIAWVRKIKPTKPKELDNGGVIPGKHYNVKLKQGYSLDGHGTVTSLFLSKEEGDAVMKQLDESIKRRYSLRAPEEEPAKVDDPVKQ
jgi:hypothetical protein